ncbi:MAG: hypothetical protein KDD51_02665 [Bdellovibrionales bacterium]|nr:hypothetical protein [Bdellovibrionales bacterium]
MTTCKDWFISLGVAVLLVSSVRAEAPALQYTLTPPQVEPGQRAVLEIRLDTRVLKNFDNDVDSIHVNETLLQSQKGLSLLAQDRRMDGTIAVWTYAFTAYDNGEYALPPLEFSFLGSSFSTENQAFRVVSTRSQDDNELREGFDETEVPRVWPKWLLPLLIILVLTAALTPIVYRLIKKYFPKKKLAIVVAEPTPPQPRESDSDWLRRHLLVFKEHMESHPADPRLVDELTTIVRNYYGRKLDYPVRSLTTLEFTKRFGNCDTGAPEMVTLFNRCDAVKFAQKAHVPYEMASSCLKTVEQALLCI